MLVSIGVIVTLQLDLNEEELLNEDLVIDAAVEQISETVISADSVYWNGMWVNVE